MIDQNRGRRPLDGEGDGFVPPRRHLRKLVHRLERLRELEPPTFNQWRVRQEGANLRYIEAYDKLIGEDLPALLDSLLGREPGGEDE